MRDRDIAQLKPEWREQWELFEDDERFLFEEWIEPLSLADLKGADILEAGCGGGQHTAMMAPLARSIVAVDLNTAELAEGRYKDLKNVTFRQADIASMELGREFDIVICVGVIHHTDDPDRTFANLLKHVRSGGRLVIWTYSSEGNGLVRHLVEPARKLVFRRLSRGTLVHVSQAITAAMYLPVHTMYRVPVLSFLPYYDYFGNFRRMPFRRNVLNVFDKLNAPQTRFTTRRKCDEWFSADHFRPESISIRPYKGVSYSLSGVKR